MSVRCDASKNNSVLDIDIEGHVQALNDCVKHAAEHYGMNITDISTAMQATSKWAVFKWIESGKMPLSEIARFEEACHARFITRYLAHKAGLLLLTKPRGEKKPEMTLVAASKAMADAVSDAADCIEGNIDKAVALKAIEAAMEAVAYLRWAIEDG